MLVFHEAILMATNTQSTSAMLSIRLDTGALAALDSFAVGRGGRSAIMRQMIEQLLEENNGRPLIEPSEGACCNRVSLRFTDAEIAVIEHRASQRSTNRSGWIKALVRRHLALKSRVDDGLLNELAPIRMQLLRIGRNLNQAMKAANLRMMDDGDKKIENDLRRIADMRMEIAEQIAAVGDAMHGDASYWAVSD
jgi:metal-responsive CopG/Arc/MetJ family transcriptional regulator